MILRSPVLSVCLLVALPLLTRCDVVTDAKYEVVFLEGTHDIIPEGSEIVPITFANGTRYACVLPPDNLEVPQSTFVPGQPLSKTSREQFDSILRNWCFTKPDGWWSFRYCHRREVLQFHVEESTMDKKIVLGNFNANEDVVTESHTVLGQFLATKFDGGTECDVTGMRRSATVRYFCAEGEAVAKLDVTEPRTCRYVVSVFHPDLCEIKELRKDDTNRRIISCYKNPLPAVSLEL